MKGDDQMSEFKYIPKEDGSFVRRNVNELSITELRFLERVKKLDYHLAKDRREYKLLAHRFLWKDSSGKELDVA